MLSGRSHAIDGDIDAVFVAVKAETVLEVAEAGGGEECWRHGHPLVRLRRCRRGSGLDYKTNSPRSPTK